MPTFRWNHITACMVIIHKLQCMYVAIYIYVAIVCLLLKVRGKIAANVAACTSSVKVNNNYMYIATMAS